MTVHELTGYFNGLLGRIQSLDFGPVIEQAKLSIEQDTADCFTNSHSPAGEPWAPIHHRIGKPLIKTGLLFSAALTAIYNGVTTRNSLTITVDQPFYGVFHQFGTARIKARPWLGITEKTRQQAYAEAVAFMVGQLLIRPGAAVPTPMAA